MGLDPATVFSRAAFVERVPVLPKPAPVTFIGRDFLPDRPARGSPDAFGEPPACHFLPLRSAASAALGPSAGEQASSCLLERLARIATSTASSCRRWSPSRTANSASSASRWARVALSKCRRPARRVSLARDKAPGFERVEQRYQDAGIDPMGGTHDFGQPVEKLPDARL